MGATQKAQRLTSTSLIAALASLGIEPLTQALAVDPWGIFCSPIMIVPSGYIVRIRLPEPVTAADLAPYADRLAETMGLTSGQVAVDPVRSMGPGCLELVMGRQAVA